MTTFAKVLVLLQFIIVFLPNFSSSSFPKFFISNAKIDSTNSSNITNGCNSKLSESAMKFIWKLMTDEVTHVIDLHVWIESVNNTMNKAQKQIRIKWANEIGRTLISLIAQAEKSNQITMDLSSTSTLQAGIYSMNIVIPTEVMQCFSSGKNTSDPAIFDLLVQELYHIGESNTDYKLCFPDSNSIQFNCCTIVGRNDVLICTKYSSVVTKTVSGLGYGAFFCVPFIAFVVPAVFIKMRFYNTKHYRISSSPMSLSFVLTSAVFGKQGPVLSSGRNFLLISFLFLITFPKWNTNSGSPWIYVSFYSVWIIFLFTNIVYFEDLLQHSIKSKTSNEGPIQRITYPFNLKKFWRNLEELQGKESQPLNDNRKDDEKCTLFMPLKYLLAFLILLVLYIIAIPVLCLISIGKLIDNSYAVMRCILSNTRSVIPTSSIGRRMIGLLVVFFWLSLMLSFFWSILLFTQNMLPLAFYFAIGLFLNGEVYSPYVLPLCTIIFYSWTKWRSSVETKYLVLLTNIYKVCKESRVESDQSSINVTENFNIASNTSDSSTKKDIFTIGLDDDDGEPIIQKELYNSVRETLLPYDEILFYYFQRVFFILIFAYFLYIMISLAQTSRVPGSIQVISTIAASSLPFIFEFVWKKNSDEEKEADSIALQSKLKRILRVLSSDEVTGDIKVECKAEGTWNHFYDLTTPPLIQFD